MDLKTFLSLNNATLAPCLCHIITPVLAVLTHAQIAIIFSVAAMR